MIDPRGPRTAAWLTTAVLAVVLLTGSGLLLAVQALVFALGTRGRSPYGLLFRRVVRPRLSPPVELEPEAPTRSAQLVGLVVATVGVVGALTGVDGLFVGATAAALAAAFLNAAFGICLGCELHLFIVRTTTNRKGVPA
ncbi:MAG: hypothetical protein JWO60_1350 [Frankiales bacterium]|nr:hypothetical protein [Frankiales bacterium]